MMTITTALTSVLLSISTFFSFDRERIIEFNELPQVSQEFIQTNFPSHQIAYIIEETELTSTTFNVKFENGDEIEFRGNGEWKDIDCEYNAVPESATPAKILEYVKAKHARNTIEKISREYNRYEVELNNGLEIVFNSNFEVLRYDD